VQSVDRIEVIRGPMSVVYGAGAFLGAINIITNRMDEKSDNQNFFSASYGSYNSAELFGKFRYKNENIQSSVNIGLLHTDGLNIAYSDLINDENRLPILGVPKDMTTENQLDEDRLTIETSLNIGKFFFNFNHIEVGKGILYFYPSTSEGSDVYKTINYFSLGYKNEINDNFEITAKVDYVEKNRLYDFNFDLSDTNFMGVKDAYFSEEYRERKIIPEVNLLWSISDKISVNIGLYSQIEKGKDKVDIPFWGSYLTNSDIYFVRKDESVYTNAIYSQLQYKPSSKLFLKFGIRAEEMMPFNVHHDISQGTDSPSSFDAKYEGS
jgi:outer membrane receptor protein involved in Fe transport